MKHTRFAQESAAQAKAERKLNWFPVAKSDKERLADAQACINELREALRKLLRHSDKLGGGCSVSDDISFARAVVAKSTGK